MASLFDLGLQGYNWYQMNSAFDDARDDITAGATSAKGDIVQYQQPYQQYGLDSIANIGNRGDFNFTYDNYLNSDNFEWLRGIGQQGVERSAAAKSNLLSGKTLTDITNYNQNFAQAQYGQEFDRQLKGWGANTEKDLAGVKIGADVGINMGNNLADLSVGTGMAKATIENARAAAVSNQLNAITDLSQVGGVPGSRLDQATGKIVDAAGNVISNIWDGGGLDGKGNWGLLGDVGGWLTGNYGDNYGDMFTSNEYSGMFSGNTNADGTPYYDPGQDFWTGGSGSTDWWGDFTTSLNDGWDSLTSWASDFFS